jgi:hypothetical protein
MEVFWRGNRPWPDGVVWCFLFLGALLLTRRIFRLRRRAVILGRPPRLQLLALCGASAFIGVAWARVAECFFGLYVATALTLLMGVCAAFKVHREKRRLEAAHQILVMLNRGMDTRRN